MRTLASLLFALASTLAWPALAAENAPAAESRSALVVRVDVGTSGLSPDVIRTAIGKELGVETAAEGDDKGSVSVRIVGNRARVSVVRPSGEKLEREVELPREASSRVEVIALLAGNLARDEAASLIASLKKPVAEPTPEPAPAPAAEPTPAPTPAPKPTPAAAPAPKAPKASAPRAAPGEKAHDSFAANLSLWSPVAIVEHTERHTFDLEAGLAYSRIGGLSGLGLNVGHLRIEGRARGVGVSGLWTRVGGDSQGAFATGILSQAGGALEGVEGAGIAALRSGNVDGVQGAGVVNTAARLRGVQLSGVVNWANGPVSGAQGTGVVNYAAEGLDGVQLSLVNIGGNVRGAQLGLVNIGGDVSGAQVGLVNVSDRIDGVPLGIVNVVKNGRTQAVAWADTDVVANAAVKYLNGPIYTLLGAGWDGGDGSAAAFALGAHIGLSRATYLEIDALYRYVSDFDDTDSDQDQHLTALRLIAGLERLGPAGAFVGGGVSQAVDADGGRHDPELYGVAGVTLF